MAGRHGDGRFLTYEDIFLPRVEHALATRDSAFLERAAIFIEKLFLTGDDYAMSVVYVEVIEGLRADCDNDKVRVLLKPVTRELFDKLAY